MASTIHDTTFAVDAATAGRLRMLAKVWHVTEAEAVKRAVSQASSAAIAEDNPVILLQQLHAKGQGLGKTVAEEYLSSVQADRQAWRAD